MKFILTILFGFPLVCVAQYKGVSYELRNEVGTYNLTSFGVSHQIDNEEGITYVTNTTGKDTLYHIDRFLNGFVGLSNDGRTVVHVQSEKNSEPLDKTILTFYRNGQKYQSGELEKLLKYELDDAEKRQALSQNNWLRNDSLLHTMASNTFYITDDKVFVSTDGPILEVFDMNQMFRIYTGNGANHFMQNYYAIPNLPFRTEFTSAEYFPKTIPKTQSGRDFSTLIANAAQFKITIPEEATYRVEIDIFIRKDASSEIRKVKVFSIKANALEEQLSASLKERLPAAHFQTETIPPNHPAWVFSEVFWMK